MSENRTAVAAPAMELTLLRPGVLECALQKAEALPALQDLTHVLDAVRNVLRSRKAALADINRLGEYRIRAAAKAGEILQRTVRAGGRKGRSHNATTPLATATPSLPEGISKHQSSRWQALTRLPPGTLDAYVEHANAADDEVTESGLRRFHRRQNEDGGPRKRGRRSLGISNVDMEAKKTTTVINRLLIDKTDPLARRLGDIARYVGSLKPRARNGLAEALARLAERVQAIGATYSNAETEQSVPPRSPVRRLTAYCNAVQNAAAASFDEEVAT